MSDANRDNLAAAQAKLVAALTAGDDSPAGFDDDRLHLTARTLLTKRRQAIAKIWPVLAESLDDRFAAMFADYAQSRPMPAEGHAADARAFAEDLLSQRELPDSGCVALLLARVQTGWPIRLIRLFQKKRWAIAIRIWRRIRWLRLPF